MGLGLEATLPLDTLYLLTLHWATPQATQGAMGFTKATLPLDTLYLLTLHWATPQA